MAAPRRQIPPFAAVRAFEAAARDGNLRDAAEQLALTPSAVSHQIRALEQYLDRALFRRSPKGLVLTPEGQLYFEEVAAALDQIERATRRAIRPTSGNTIRLCCYISLTQSWFLPRLAALRRALPDLDLRLISLIDPFEADPGDVDLVLASLDSPPPGKHVDPLIEEEIFPVASPALARREALAAPEDLARLPLLACYGNEDDWPQWALTAGLPPRSLPPPAMLFETQALLQDAAAAGLGVALARLPFVADELAGGRLERPFAVSHFSGQSYCLIGDPQRVEEPPLASFRDWIIGQFNDMKRLQQAGKFIQLKTMAKIKQSSGKKT